MCSIFEQEGGLSTSTQAACCTDCGCPGGDFCVDNACTPCDRDGTCEGPPQPPPPSKPF